MCGKARSSASRVDVRMRGTASRAPIARRSAALTDFRNLRVCSRVRPVQKVFLGTLRAMDRYRHTILSCFMFLKCFVLRRIDSMKCAVNAGFLAAQSTTNIPPTKTSGNLSCRSEAANICMRVTSVACEMWSNGNTFSRRRDAITRRTLLQPFFCVRRIFCSCARRAILSAFLLAHSAPSVGRQSRFFMWNRLECSYVSRGAGILSRNDCGKEWLLQGYDFEKIPNRNPGNHTRQPTGSTTKHKPRHEAGWSRRGSRFLHAVLETALGREPPFGQHFFRAKVSSVFFGASGHACKSRRTRGAHPRRGLLQFMETEQTITHVDLFCRLM